MIQPKYFSFNHETAISNIFQKKINFEDVKDKAINEWANLKQILEDNYFEIVELVPSPKSPDGLFPNWFMTHKNRYDLFSMEAQNRRHEINTESLFILNKKHELNLDFRKFSSEKKFLESTSSLVLDRINHIAYCALSSRSDINLAKKCGFTDPRLVSSNPITIQNKELEDKIGHIKFYSATYRLFKLPNMLEPDCEDYGQAVIYRGTIPYNPEYWELDGHHKIIKGKIFPVCGNTWNMLKHSRFQEHFTFIGDFNNHYGIFDGCGKSMPFDNSVSDNKCC